MCNSLSGLSYAQLAAHDECKKIPVVSGQVWYDPITDEDLYVTGSSLGATLNGNYWPSDAWYTLLHTHKLYLKKVAAKGLHDV